MVRRRDSWLVLPPLSSAAAERPSRPSRLPAATTNAASSASAAAPSQRRRPLPLGGDCCAPAALGFTRRPWPLLPGRRLPWAWRAAAPASVVAGAAAALLGLLRLSTVPLAAPSSASLGRPRYALLAPGCDFTTVARGLTAANAGAAPIAVGLWQPPRRCCRGGGARLPCSATPARGVALAAPSPGGRRLPDDIKPGMQLEVTVVAKHRRGLTVEVRPGLLGLVPMALIRNISAETRSKLGDNFLFMTRNATNEVCIGQRVQARVLNNQAELVLTMRDAYRRPLDDYGIGEKVAGVVKSVISGAAFVDIGSHKDAYLPSYRMRGYIEDARDVLSVGEHVEVFVVGKFPELSLSMIPRINLVKAKPLPLMSLTLADLKVGEVYGGKVVDVFSFGVFVDVGAEEQGLIHVRNINHGIVPNISDLFEKQDWVTVRVLRNEPTEARPLELTLESPLQRMPAVDQFADVDKNLWLNGLITHLEERGFYYVGAYIIVDHPHDGSQVTAFMDSMHTANITDINKGRSLKVRIESVDVERRQVFVTTMRAELGARRGRRAGASASISHKRRGSEPPPRP